MLRKSGFTLAEVLITLGIIGVVAAMTIPTLISQTNDAEYKSAFKKAVSSLNQAVTMSVALEGNDFSDLTTGTGDGSMYYMFTNRMNVVSTGSSSVIGNYFNVAGNYTLFFNDGMAITFPTTAAACTTLGQSHCSLVVDVNGTKKPNTITTATSTTVGSVRDQYPMNFYNQQVVPKSEAARYILFN